MCRIYENTKTDIVQSVEDFNQGEVAKFSNDGITWAIGILTYVVLANSTTNPVKTPYRDAVGRHWELIKKNKKGVNNH